MSSLTSREAAELSFYCASIVLGLIGGLIVGMLLPAFSF
jgi:hypothetical protein